MEEGGAVMKVWRDAIPMFDSYETKIFALHRCHYSFRHHQLTSIGEAESLSCGAEVKELNSMKVKCFCYHSAQKFD